MHRNVLRIGSLDDFEDLVGRPLVCPEVLTMTQERIDRFAGALEDFQWIHVDPSRAARESPFNATIAHGFLSLALLTWFLERTIAVEAGTMGLNYGFDRVRFVRPAPAGARLSGRFTLAKLEKQAWGVQLHWDAAITDAADAEAGWLKPILAARWLVRRYA